MIPICTLCNIYHKDNIRVEEMTIDKQEESFQTFIFGDSNDSFQAGGDDNEYII